MTRLETSEATQVLRWRLRTLVSAGYSLADAATLAVHAEIDLHRAVELVRRGCPPPTAVRILV